jgi:hypothetical protein
MRVNVGTVLLFAREKIVKVGLAYVSVLVAIHRVCAYLLIPSSINIYRPYPLCKSKISVDCQ